MLSCAQMLALSRRHICAAAWQLLAGAVGLLRSSRAAATPTMSRIYELQPGMMLPCGACSQSRYSGVLTMLVRRSSELAMLRVGKQIHNAG